MHVAVHVAAWKCSHEAHARARKQCHAITEPDFRQFASLFKQMYMFVFTWQTCAEMRVYEFQSQTTVCRTHTPPVCIYVTMYTSSQQTVAVKQQHKGMPNNACMRTHSLLKS